MLTIGSLFDGAGGFPLAGTYAGFTPTWLSEIEPYPIRVTTKRFPEAKHSGDITKINGGKITPVDVITFGSPCQDLSIANNNRQGLGGERSGLFYEAVRIIKEMREATNGRYPTFIVWENVHGAFSSNKGEDFKQVLEEICQIKNPGVSIPRPDGGKWFDAGEIVGDGFSLAWRTLDARYWGVPQRRRRIFLVGDFTGRRAGRILFERESVSGYTPTGEIERKRIAGDITVGVGNAIAFEPGACSRVDGHIWDDGATRALRSHMGDNQLAVAIETAAGFIGHKSITGNICYNDEQSPCIETRMPPNVIYPKQAIAIENNSQDSRLKICDDGNVQTLTQKMGTGGNNTPMVLSIDRAAYNQGKNAQFGISIQEELSQTIVAKGPHAVFAIGNGQANQTGLHEKAGTLDCMDGRQLLMICQEKYIVRRITPLECCRLQGFPDDWCADLETPNPTEQEMDRWSAIFETHRLAVNPGIKPKTRNQIKKWLKNPNNDSAQYKMWGNSLAIPCAYNVLKGIADELRKE